MRITAIEEYGLRCMLTLVKEGNGKQMSISEIAKLEGLSVPYVSKLLSILRRANLVSAVRGRNGGFIVDRSPEKISLYEILTSLGGPLVDPDHCKRHSGLLSVCVHTNNCSVQDVLGGLAGYIQEFLLSTSLQDLACGPTQGIVIQNGTSISVTNTTLKIDSDIKEKEQNSLSH